MKTTVNKNIGHKQNIKKIKKKLTRAIASASPPLTAQPVNLTTKNVQISPQNTSNTQTTQFKQTDIQNLPPYHTTELQNHMIRSNFTQCYPIFPPEKAQMIESDPTNTTKCINTYIISNRNASRITKMKQKSDLGEGNRTCRRFAPG